MFSLESGQRTERSDPGSRKSRAHSTQDGVHPEADPVGPVRVGQEEPEVPKDERLGHGAHRSQVES